MTVPASLVGNATKLVTILTSLASSPAKLVSPLRLMAGVQISALLVVFD